MRAPAAKHDRPMEVDAIKRALLPKITANELQIVVVDARKNIGVFVPDRPRAERARFASTEIDEFASAVDFACRARSEIAQALDKSISKIEEAILSALESTPPELSADIYKTGIYLAGGGALLRGLDKRISIKTKLPVHVADDPLRAVARGTGIALKNIDRFQFLMRD